MKYKYTTEKYMHCTQSKICRDSERISYPFYIPHLHIYIYMCIQF